MFSLGIDTSNYATSLALVNTNSQEVVCTKKQFLPVKNGELGLRQSDALFHHTVALPALLQEISAQFDLHQIQSIGVSTRPRDIEGSYMPCFLAGRTFAMAFAAGANLTVKETSHQQGHIAAALYGAKLFPLQVNTLLFHISGGTTDLLLVTPAGEITQLGTSLDLYAGQAVDRLGVKLGFSFPTGEQVSQLAEDCSDEILPKASVKGLDCHLSGLQNQYEALLQQGYSPAYVAKYTLLSIAVTVKKMVQNVRSLYGQLPLVCAGGVMCSTTIRSFLLTNLENLYFAPPELSSDNAVGVALIAGTEESFG